MNVNQPQDIIGNIQKQPSSLSNSIDGSKEVSSSGSEGDSPENKNHKSSNNFNSRMIEEFISSEDDESEDQHYNKNAVNNFLHDVYNQFFELDQTQRIAKKFQYMIEQEKIQKQESIDQKKKKSVMLTNMRKRQTIREKITGTYAKYAQKEDDGKPHRLSIRKPLDLEDQVDAGDKFIGNRMDSIIGNVNNDIDPQVDDVKHKKKKKEAKLTQNEDTTNTQFDFNNPEINQLINQKGQSSVFAQIWAKLILLIHTYNIITVFYFIGVKGRPEGLWLMLELTSEFFIAFDFILRLILRKYYTNQFQQMWLLHDEGTKSYFYFVVRLVASIPQSIILYAVYQNNLIVLESIQVSLLRLLKLLRMRQVTKYFQVKQIENRSQSRFYMVMFQVIYYFLVATHLIGCLWLMVGRLDPNRDNWFVMIGFEEFFASPFQRYLDSVYFVVATMTGLGYGNVVPSTNLEYVIDIFIMMIGSSIYANFFASFAVQIYNRNKSNIENMKKLEQAKQYATLRNLPETSRNQIRQYYTNLRIKFSDLREKYNVLHELPTSLRSELSLFFNSELIQHVKFFQFSEPFFILEISGYLTPSISLSNDYIVDQGEIAESMYFVFKGIVKILATDNKSVIAYQGAGCYFGEIGVLLTEKRSTSVQAKVATSLFSIGKEDLLQLIERYPKEGKFLRAVGRQRLQTTSPSDINPKDVEFENIENINLDHPDDIKEHTNNLIENQKIKSMKLKTLRLNRTHSLKSQSFLKENVKWNLTYEFRYVQENIIIPFSFIYMIWSTILLIAFSYYLIYVPLSLALDLDLSGNQYYIDLIALAIYILDIPFRLRVATEDPKNIQIDQDLIENYYWNKVFLYDLIAILPFDYIMLLINFDPFVVRMFRVCRLFKLVRIIEIYYVNKLHSNKKMPLLTTYTLFVFFIVASHYIACIYIFIGQRQIGTQFRFDGQYMFSDVTNRNFVTFEDAVDMSKASLYINFLYLSSCTMGAVMYGDIIPFTMAEQFFTFLAMFTARIFLAFLFAEAASYLSSIHLSRSTNTQKLNRITKWMKLNNFPSYLHSRVTRYHDIVWQNFKGINEEQILQDLPPGLRTHITSNIYHSLVANWNLFPKDNPGAKSTILKQLKPKIIPKGEFIIRAGEVAEEMYFILNGTVEIISVTGAILVKLEDGAHFGEMALLENQNLRSASAIAMTNVSVAVLDKKSFKMICNHYPDFYQRLKKVINERKDQNLKQEQLHQDIDDSFDDKFDDDMLSQKSSNDQKRKSGLSEIQENVNDSKSYGLQSQILTSQKLSRNEINKIMLTNNQKTANDNSKDSLPGLPIQKIDTIVQQQTTEETNQDNNLMTTDRQVMTSRELIESTDKKSSEKENKFAEVMQMGGTRDSQNNAKTLKKATTIEFTIHNIKNQRLVNNIEDHFKNKFKENGSIAQTLSKIMTYRNFMQFAIFILLNYNIFFIPLQFAFDIPFQGIYLFMEVLSVCLYLLDTILRYLNLRKLQEAQGNIVGSGNKIERTVMEDKEEFYKRINHLKIQTITSLVAAIPISYILYLKDFENLPILVACALRLFRLIKFRPMVKFFDQLKKRDLNFWRVIEVVISYYYICHVLSCVMISLGNRLPDARETWFRRIPVPQDTGIRENSTLDDMTPLSIYIHAMYFIVNTISHVAIGDITSVTAYERAFNAFLILLGTFIYSFLYGNIASIVSDFAPNQFINFQEKQYLINHRLSNTKTPKKIVNAVNQYYDYQWINFNGIDQQEFFDDLPDSIKADINLCLYQMAIENSLIFKNEEAKIDVSLTNSVFKQIHIRTYLKNDFMIKLGQHDTNTYIILDGGINMIGAFNCEILGIFQSGSLYSTDLKDDSKFKRKAINHLIANQLSVVGVLQQEDIDKLYASFPYWKKKVQQINFITHKLAQPNLEKYISQQQYEISQDMKPIDIIENHITFATQLIYDNILQVQSAKYQESAGRVGKEIFKIKQDINLKVMKRFYNNRGSVTNQIYDNFYKRTQTAIYNIRNKNGTLSQLPSLSKINTLEGKSNEQGDVNSEIQPNREALKTKFMDFKIPVWKNGIKYQYYFNSIQLLNLLYMGLFIPFTIGFDVQLTNGLAQIELLSVIVAIATLIVHISLPFMIKGEPTVMFRTKIAYYYQNGLVSDLCACLPTNLIIGSIDFSVRNTNRSLFVFLTFLRLIRLYGSIQKTLYLYGYFEAQMKKFNFLVSVIKATMLLVYLSHWVSCIWYFVNDQWEDPTEETWLQYHSLHDKQLFERYLLSIYLVINVVTSVGYGDMFPMTDTERVLLMIIITLGDALFAGIFGMIAAISMRMNNSDEIRNFVDKVQNIQEFMNNFNINEESIIKIDQFFAYEFQNKHNSQIISKENLTDLLPYSLLKDVVYYQTKNLLTPMFSQFGSENFTKEISYVLKTQLYLPSDLIIKKDEVGEEMFFIAEGRVFILASDQLTVVARLKTGDYFGEIAILIENQRRTSYVQAEIFCRILILKKEELDKILINYPKVRQMIQVKAQKRMAELNKIQNFDTKIDYMSKKKEAQDPNNMNDKDFVNNLQENILKQNDLMYITNNEAENANKTPKQQQQVTTTNNMGAHQGSTNHDQSQPIQEKSSSQSQSDSSDVNQDNIISKAEQILGQNSKDVNQIPQLQGNQKQVSKKKMKFQQKLKHIKKFGSKEYNIQDIKPRRSSLGQEEDISPLKLDLITQIQIGGSKNSHEKSADHMTKTGQLSPTKSKKSQNKHKKYLIQQLAKQSEPSASATQHKADRRASLIQQLSSHQDKQILKLGQNFSQQVHQLSGSMVVLKKDQQQQKSNPMVKAKSTKNLLSSVFKSSQNKVADSSSIQMPRRNSTTNIGKSEKSNAFFSMITGEHQKNGVDNKQTIRRENHVNKNERRLSNVSLGKNLMLSQASGLKLQWTVGK